MRLEPIEEFVFYPPRDALFIAVDCVSNSRQLFLQTDGPLPSLFKHFLEMQHEVRTLGGYGILHQPAVGLHESYWRGGTQQDPERVQKSGPVVFWYFIWTTPEPSPHGPKEV